MWFACNAKQLVVPRQRQLETKETRTTSQMIPYVIHSIDVYNPVIRFKVTKIETTKSNEPNVCVCDQGPKGWADSQIK